MLETFSDSAVPVVSARGGGGGGGSVVDLICVWWTTVSPVAADVPVGAADGSPPLVLLKSTDVGQKELANKFLAPSLSGGTRWRLLATRRRHFELFKHSSEEGMVVMVEVCEGLWHTRVLMWLNSLTIHHLLLPYYLIVNKTVWAVLGWRSISTS